jgi:hypothetical protein
MYFITGLEVNIFLRLVHYTSIKIYLFVMYVQRHEKRIKSVVKLLTGKQYDFVLIILFYM